MMSSSLSLIFSVKTIKCNTNSLNIYKLSLLYCYPLQNFYRISCAVNWSHQIHCHAHLLVVLILKEHGSAVNNNNNGNL